MPLSRRSTANRTILDLCGGTGSWSKPYLDAGYDVHLISLPQDVRLIKFDYKLKVHGILCAPPCTCFSYARNRYPPSRDELINALSIVDACLRAVVIYRPIWWALENPQAKLRHYLGPSPLTFYQWEFGDDGHKPTCIWGDFNIPIKSPTLRKKLSTWRTKVQNASKKDQITPPKFAQAFFKANP